MHAYKARKEKSNVKVRLVITDCTLIPHIVCAGFVVCISETLPRPTKCGEFLLQNIPFQEAVMGSQGKQFITILFFKQNFCSEKQKNTEHEHHMMLETVGL